MEFGRLETSVVVNTTTDSRELGVTAVDDKTDGKVEDSEALADNTVVDVAIGKTAESAKEVADLFIVEEAIECIVETAEKVTEESGVEVATG